MLKLLPISSLTGLKLKAGQISQHYNMQASLLEEKLQNNLLVKVLLNMIQKASSSESPFQSNLFKPY